MKAKIAAICLSFIGLTACQTVKPPATASGRPEVTISGVTPAQVKPVLVNKTIDKGYRIVKDDAYSLTFEKPSDSFAANVFLGTRAGGPPVQRVSFTIAEVGGATRVVADAALVSNAGMAFEQRTDVSSGALAPQVQGFLDEVAAQAAPAPTKKIARR